MKNHVLAPTPFLKRHNLSAITSEQRRKRPSLLDLGSGTSCPPARPLKQQGCDGGSLGEGGSSAKAGYRKSKILAPASCTNATDPAPNLRLVNPHSNIVDGLGLATLVRQFVEFVSP
jgi:hypothetical protein